MQNEPLERAWRMPELDHDVAGRFLAQSFAGCSSAEQVPARVERIESTYDALIKRLGSAGFDPAPFKARLRSIAAARTAAIEDVEVAK